MIPARFVSLLMRSALSFVLAVALSSTTAVAQPGAGAVVELLDPQAKLVAVQPLSEARASELAHKHPYQFRPNKDWFTHNLAMWTALLTPYMGKPGLRYLEIGVYEGRSMLWVVDHVLTHPDSHATGIDIGIGDRLKENVRISGAKERTTLIESSSQDALRAMTNERFDIIYIDGAHTADAVLDDLVRAWFFLKPGGLMILDDYRFIGRTGNAANLPPELRPGLAIRSFVSSYRDYVRIVLSGYQLAIEKREDVCTRGKKHCSMLGPYAYYWTGRALYDGDKKVPLYPKERQIVEALIRGKAGDGLRMRLDRSQYDSPAFTSLNSRLHLGLRAWEGVGAAGLGRHGPN